MLYPDTTPRYLDIISTYCDINDLARDQAQQELAQIIIDQQYNNLVTFHGQGFLWWYFDQLIKGHITMEQFMTMGDIEGQIEDQINPHVYREEHPVQLDSLTPDIVSSRDKKTLVIIEPRIIQYYEHKHGPIQTTAKIIIINPI